MKTPGNSVALRMLTPLASATSGNDTIVGSSGADTLYGLGGDDSLKGVDGDDTLSGGEGTDILRGGQGDDVLWGGAGFDKLYGGAGDDLFEFHIYLGGSPPPGPPDEGLDRIVDFAEGEDRIYIIPGDALGDVRGLTTAEFCMGPAATDASDRVIYDPVTGIISYDMDGDGAAAAIEFAKVDPGTVLTWADFLTT